MPIDFPAGPTTGDVYTYLGKSWVWNGTGWDVATPNVGDAFLPAGSIIQWSSVTLPANWLICNGAAVSRNTYSSLFAAIGTVYGAGDGTTTFNLPDLRGRVAVGLDSTQTEFDTLGESGGAKTHTLTIAEMPSHTHAGSSGATPIVQSGNGLIAGSGNPPVNSAGNIAQATGGGQAHNNLQPYEVLHYIIKASAGTTSGDSELATRLGVTEAAVSQRPQSGNLIINGAFDFWQRGTSFTGVGTSYAYQADRFRTVRGAFAGGINVSRQPAGLDGFEYAMKIQRQAGNTGTQFIGMDYALETKDSMPLVGKTITLSFYAKAGANFSAPSLGGAILTGTGNDQPVSGFTNLTSRSVVNAALTTSWQRFTTTATIPTGVTQIGISFTSIPTGTAGAEDSVFITGVQLEAGAVATPFRRNAPSIQAELAACQRYFHIATNFLIAAADDDYAVNMANVTLPVTMRANPTVTILASQHVGHHSDLPTLINGNNHGFYAEWSGSAYRSVGSRIILVYQASAEL
jgi:microcystin-dependent protein